MIGRAACWLGLVLLALGALLLFPRVEQQDEARSGLRAVLFDASASAARRRPGFLSFARDALRGEAQAAVEAGEELAVVVYGADVTLVQPPGSPALFLERLDGPRAERPRLLLEAPADSGTLLAAAIGLIEGELVAAQRAPGTLVVIGDRGWTGADPGARLEKLARAGCTLRLVELTGAGHPDLALEELRLDPAPPVGAPLVAAAQLALHPGASGLAALRERAELTLEVELDTAEGLQRFELPLAWPAAAGVDPDGIYRWTVPVALGATQEGNTLLSARVRLTAPGALRDGDPIPENDTHAATTRAGERRIAVAVARASELELARAFLGAAKRYPGIDWSVLTPSELLEFEGELDLIASFDLGADELPPRFIRDFVLEGGGWFACGGWGMLALESGELGDLLPLRPQQGPTRDRDVVFMVDGSGSMAGEPFSHVKEALARLAAAALPGDHLALRLFTGALQPAQALTAGTPAARRRAMRKLLEARVPGGETAIVYSLESLVKEPRADRPGLVLLLSDGRDFRAFDVEERSRALRAALAAQQTELTIIAVGENADLDFLRAVSGPDRELVIAGDLGDLTELFQREIHRERLREGDALRVEAVAPDSLAAQPLAQQVVRAQSTLPGDQWPTAQRLVRAEARREAAVLWVDDEGRPVLGMQRVGRGRTAAWESSPAPGWSPEFEGAAALFEPLFLALAQGANDERGMSLRIEAGRMLLSGLLPEVPARVRVEFFAPALASSFDGSGMEASLGSLVLTPPASGSDVRRTRIGARPDFHHRVPGGAVLRASLTELESGRGIGSFAVRLGVSPEFELRAGDLRLPDTPGEPRAEARTGRTRESDRRGPWLVAAGLLALFAGTLAGGRVPGLGPPGVSGVKRRAGTPEKEIVTLSVSTRRRPLSR